MGWMFALLRRLLILAHSSHFSAEITLNRVLLMRFDKINNCNPLLKDLVVQQSSRNSMST